MSEEKSNYWRDVMTRAWNEMSDAADAKVMDDYFHLRMIYKGASAMHEIEYRNEQSRRQR